MIIVNSLAEAFRRGLLALNDAGKEVVCREKKTIEIMPIQFCIIHPRRRLFYHPSRTFNVAFAIAETLSYICGFNSVKYLSFFNSNVAQFSDDGEKFYGAYGPRLKPFWSELIQKLKDDSTSRQAVMSVYCARDGLHVKTKDVPCTLNLMFTIRDGKLHLHTTMRSNDIVWGFQYDVFAFTMLQEIVAQTLEVELGHYYHTVNSFHIYDYHYHLLKEPDDVESIEMLPMDVDLTRANVLGQAAWDFALGTDQPLRLSHPLTDVLLAYCMKKIGLQYKIYLPEWAKRFM
jgi:thymidylate synthase